MGNTSSDYMPPYLETVDGKRRFACAPVAVLALIVNRQEEILMLSHPQRAGSWEVVNGALEAGESVLDAVLRETREEAGPAVKIRPLGTVHVTAFHYDEHVRYMLSIAYLLAYEGGEVQPGDDMARSEYRWWRLDDLLSPDMNLIVPPEKWVVERAVELYRLWRDSNPADLPGFGLSQKGKTKG